MNFVPPIVILAEAPMFGATEAMCGAYERSKCVERESSGSDEILK